jgi:hypothetical protein
MLVASVALAVPATATGLIPHLLSLPGAHGRGTQGCERRCHTGGVRIVAAAGSRVNGGQAKGPSEEPAREYSWKTFQSGHTVSTVHGADRDRHMAPLAGQIVERCFGGRERPEHLKTANRCRALRDMCGSGVSFEDRPTRRSRSSAALSEQEARIDGTNHGSKAQAPSSKSVQGHAVWQSRQRSRILSAVCL